MHQPGMILARVCGLRVPETLMSNSPVPIREFVDRNASAIGKGFSPHVWQRSDEEGVSVTETFKLTPELCHRNDVQTYAPGIYQERVDKQFDIRMVVMGQKGLFLCAAQSKKALDWRQDAGSGNVQVEIIPTPPDVEKGILEFARKSKICFGSVDFAVDNNGQWWFLEINEQGQFMAGPVQSSSPDSGEVLRFHYRAGKSSASRWKERMGLFPSFSDFITHFRSLPENQEPIDIAAAVAASPFMSRETGRAG